MFAAPTELGYELDDWRDPFIFWNETAGAEYWMLMTARRRWRAGPQPGLHRSGGQLGPGDVGGTAAAVGAG